MGLFRGVEKEKITVLLPVDVATEVRSRAALGRRSLSEVMTDLLCAGLRLDPRPYGIHRKRARKAAGPEPVSA